MRSPNRWVAGLVLALLVALPGVARSARTDWRELTVGHFHLYSTLRDSATRDVARQLQAFEQTVGLMLQSEDRLPDVPTTIYLLDRDDFANYAAPRPGLGGFFQEERYGNLIAVDADMPSSGLRTAVFHEYTHFIERSTSTLSLPPWCSEGYAELFSSVRIVKNTIIVGEQPPTARWTTNAGEWIPMERMLAVKHSDAEYNDPQAKSQFYGEAWLLVHLLLFDDRTLGRPTNVYLRNIDRGVPEPESFKDAFPFDKAGLDVAVHKLIASHRVRTLTLTFKDPVAVESAAITRLSAADADVAFARLIFLLGRPPPIVRPLIAAALREHPADPSVWALAARIAAHEGATIDVGDQVTALGGGTSNVGLRIDLAAALMAQGGKEPEAKRVLTLLDDVVRDTAAPIEAVQLWADAARSLQAEPARLIAVLEPASARVPHDTKVLEALAVALERRGDKARAKAYYERMVRVSSDSSERAWAQMQADSGRLQNDASSSPKQ